MDFEYPPTPTAPGLSALGSLVAFCPTVCEGDRVDRVLEAAIALIAFNPNFDDSAAGFESDSAASEGAFA